jgi:holin-like protein
VVKYQSLMETEGLRIFVVLLISTVLVLGITAAVVDRVYRFELQLSRRKSNRHYQKLTKHTEH